MAASSSSPSRRAAESETKAAAAAPGGPALVGVELPVAGGRVEEREGGIPPNELRRLLLQDTCVVLRRALRSWPSGAACVYPAAHWTPEIVAKKFGAARTTCRLHRRSEGSQSLPAEAPLESACAHVPVTVAAFVEWLTQDKVPPGHTLAGYPRALWWGYLDYKHLEELCSAPDAAVGAEIAADEADLSAALRSEREGQGPREEDFGASTGRPLLWLGSAGATTPTHYDAYSVNISAQVYGAKRWRLWPAGERARLRVRRLPYEESSVWLAGATSAAPAPLVDVTLEAGDVLCVPFQWWHAVHCVSEQSLTLNQWFCHPCDARARLMEACARAVSSALLRPLLPVEAWLNTHYDELLEPEEDIALVARALEASGGHGHGGPAVPERGESAQASAGSDSESSLDAGACAVHAATLAEAFMSPRVLAAVAEELLSRAKTLQPPKKKPKLQGG